MRKLGTLRYADFAFQARQEMFMKNKVFLVMLLSIAALSAGCNTVAGAGKDIQRGGEKIEGAATK
jgi:predicted small secreted protein